MGMDSPCAEHYNMLQSLPEEMWYVLSLVAAYDGDRAPASPLYVAALLCLMLAAQEGDEPDAETDHTRPLPPYLEAQQPTFPRLL